MTRMKRTGNTRGHEEVAAVADGAAQVDPDDRDHGVTIRRTRAMASPPVTSGDQAQDEEGPEHRRRRVAQQGQAAEPDQRPAVRRPEAEHLEGLGQRAGRQQVAAQERQHEADDERGRERLLGRPGERGEEGAEAAHGGGGADAHQEHAERVAPVGAEGGGRHAPDDQDGGQPGDGRWRAACPTRWRSAGSGAAASRASVPVERSIRSERMPRPLPMKRNTTAIDGAK